MGKKIIYLLIIFLSISLVLNALSPIKAVDKAIVVPDDYPTITAALINSQDGDIIFVKNGTYIENQLNVTKSILLLGEDANSTRIMNMDKLDWEPTLQPFSPPTPKVIQITASNVKISGFTLSCEYGWWAPIEINADNALIIGNILDQSGSTIVNGNNNTIIQNLFTKEVVGPFLGCMGANNIIASNVMIREGDMIDAYLNIKGASNLVYNNTLKNSIIEVSGDKNVIDSNNFVTGGLVISEDSSDCTISNQRVDFLNLMGLNHIFFENEIGGMEIGGIHGALDSANNTFYRNNFVGQPPELRVSTKTPGPLIWDNGMEGNYWGGYQSSDTNNDGIGDLPYKVNAAYTYFDGAIREETLVACGQDNFPLMQPIQISNIVLELPQWVNPSSTAAPTGSKSQPMFPQEILVLVVSTVIVIIISASIVYYKRGLC